MSATTAGTKNLEPTIAQVLATLEPGDLLTDYSSGTGILTRRLLDRIGHEVGILNVDASRKDGFSRSTRWPARTCSLGKY
jgi:hypothetical protein